MRVPSLSYKHARITGGPGTRSANSGQGLRHLIRRCPVAKAIPLTRGLVVLVDDEDYEAAIDAGPWWAVGRGYTFYAERHISRTGTRRTTGLHTFLTGWPYVDHRNGDGLDNRRANLRQATHAQNMGNRRMAKNNKSGFKGVSWNASRRCWCACIGVAGKVRHLGGFRNAEDAARAYDAAAVAVWGEFARINFSREGIATVERLKEMVSGGTANGRP